MNPSSAKVGLRIVGTIIGLFGMLVVCMSIVMLYGSLAERELLQTVLSAFSLMLGAYLVRVGYISWFRFSPRAVRHICGSVAFFVLTQVAPTHDANTAFGGVIFFGCLVAAYFGYRAMSDRLNHWIFRSGSDAVSKVV